MRLCLLRLIILDITVAGTWRGGRRPRWWKYWWPWSQRYKKIRYKGKKRVFFNFGNSWTELRVAGAQKNHVKLSRGNFKWWQSHFKDSGETTDNTFDFSTFQLNAFVSIWNEFPATQHINQNLNSEAVCWNIFLNNDESKTVSNLTLLQPQLVFSMLRTTERETLRTKLKTLNFKCTLMLSCLKWNTLSC